MTDTLAKLACELSGAVAAYQPTPDPVANAERDRIIEVAREITMAVSSPMHFTWLKSIDMFSLVSLRTVIELGVLEKIPMKGMVSIEQLAKQTGVQDSLLSRLLRTLAFSKIVTTNEQGEYGHTPQSLAYSAPPAAGVLSPAMLYSSGYDVVFMSMVGLHKYLQDRKSFTEPDDQAYNPFSWFHGKDGTSCWDIQKQVGDEETFQTVLSTMDKEVPAEGAFDFASLISPSEPNRTMLVDVAGGIGATLGNVVRSNPALQSCADKIALEDRSPVIEQALKVGVLPKEARTVVHDFFTEQPIKGARAYMLRRILHDWSDAKCVEILKPLAAAAAPDTSILVSELVVPENIGEKDLATICSDMAMMHMGGKERTEAQWSKIFSDAGLTLTKVWKGFERESLLEAKLTGAPAANGINGHHGTNGVNGVNGTNGVNGVNGVNGTNGVNGVNGYH